MTDELEKPFRLIAEYTLDQNSSFEQSFRLTLTVGDISDLDPVGPQYVLGLGFDGLSFASPKLAFTQFIKPLGLSFQAFGIHNAFKLLQNANPAGFNSQALGTAGIVNKNQEAKPAGFNAQGIGSAHIYNSVQHLRANGFSPLSFGNPAMLGGVRWVISVGFGSMAFGNPAVISLRRYLEAGGKDSSIFGTALIDFKNRPVHTSGAIFNAAGIPRVEHAIRMLQVSGFTHSNVSAGAWIAFKTRSIAPNGIEEPAAGRPLVGGDQQIGPFGFDDSRFGTRVIPEILTISALGFTGEFGSAEISLKKRYLAVKGFLITGNEDAQRWGYAKVWNLRQYIVQTFIHDSGLVPPEIVGWTSIENRNRTMQASGFVHSKFGHALIENTGRALEVKGFDAYAGFGKGMIAYRVRKIKMDGIEPPYMSSWHIAYNTAAVLKPAGFNAQSFGIAGIENTRRNFKRIGNIESQTFGFAFISYRVRTVNIEARYSIAPPPIRMHSVHLNTRYIDAVGGIDSLISGYGEVFERWTKIAPKWALRDFFGTPHLHNVTPELRIFGHDSVDFGGASIRTQWRNVDAQGNTLSSYGKPEIAFRNRSFDFSGWHSMQFGTARMTKTAQPPFTDQRIWLNVVSIDGQEYAGHGIKPLENQIPAPGINQNVLYPAGIFRSVLGSPSVRSNVIQIQSGIQVLEFGNPSVGNKNRAIGVKGFDNKIETGRPRISPNIIYAVMEAPAQAKENNPAVGMLHFVNSDGGSRAPGEVFGSTTITNRHRDLRNVSAWGNLSVGHPSVFNRKSNIGVKGFASYRAGWHIVGPFEQGLDQFDSVNFFSSGHASIQHREEIGVQRIHAGAMNMLAFGGQRVELLNRSLGMRGYDALQMGTRLFGDGPFMWQGLRIGSLVNGNYGGFNAEKIGQAWISLKVREVRPVSFEMLQMSYDFTRFDQRMIVKRTALPSPQAQSIGVIGFASSILNAPNIGNMVHYICPYGNGDNYRKGAPDAD
ncbi:MAG: hypothetical protein RR932_06130 [Acinetobacter sp.]